MRVQAATFRWVWAVATCGVVLCSAAAAVEENVKKDADLPPEIAKLPFEIRDGYRHFAKRCTTCHDPHNIPRGPEAATHYNAVCQQCHAASLPRTEPSAIELT